MTCVCVCVCVCRWVFCDVCVCVGGCFGDVFMWVGVLVTCVCVDGWVFW